MGGEKTGRSQEVVSFQNVWKRYGDIVAARDLNLSIDSGEFLSFLGPSGCGKTTLLRMIAGFEQPDEGIVCLKGESVNGVPAYRRPVNMVFQQYALFPHLNIADNVAYGLKQRQPKPTARELDRRVAAALELVRLSGYQRRRIWEISGGQQQRVALSRALINRPDVLLLDEPLAALDRKLRREMQLELQSLQRSVGITFVLVTHDQEEALSMSDRVCIMRAGEIIQVGSPRELYDQPLNRYVADFVGKSNFFDGVIAASDSADLTVRLGSGDLVCAGRQAGADYAVGQAVALGVRPEQILLARSSEHLRTDGSIVVEATVRNRIFLGEHTEYLLFSRPLGEFLALLPRQNEFEQTPIEVGESIKVGWSREANLVFGDS